MTTETQESWVGWAKHGWRPWSAVATAATKEQAEDLASRHARAQGWKICEVLALRVGERPYAAKGTQRRFK